MIAQTQLADTDLDVVLVQKPHHDRLAVVGGNDADAQVQLLVTGGNLDAAVLTPPTLRNVHTGQDLDPRDQRAQEAPRRAIPLDQDAVDAISNTNAVLKGLDVNVRSTQLYSFGNHQLHQFHDRSAVFVHGLVVGCGFSFGFGKIDRSIGEFLQHRVGTLTLDLTVTLVDRLQNAGFRGQCDFDFAIQDESQLVERFQVQGITGQHS